MSSTPKKSRLSLKSSLDKELQPVPLKKGRLSTKSLFNAAVACPPKMAGKQADNGLTSSKEDGVSCGNKMAGKQADNGLTSSKEDGVSCGKSVEQNTENISFEDVDSHAARKSARRSISTVPMSSNPRKKVSTFARSVSDRRSLHVGKDVKMVDEKETVTVEAVVGRKSARQLTSVAFVDMNILSSPAGKIWKSEGSVSAGRKSSRRSDVQTGTPGLTPSYAPAAKQSKTYEPSPLTSWPRRSSTVGSSKLVGADSVKSRRSHATDVATFKDSVGTRVARHSTLTAPTILSIRDEGLECQFTGTPVTVELAGSMEIVSVDTEKSAASVEAGEPSQAEESITTGLEKASDDSVTAVSSDVAPGELEEMMERNDIVDVSVNNRHVSIYIIM